MQDCAIGPCLLCVLHVLVHPNYRGSVVTTFTTISNETRHREKLCLCFLLGLPKYTPRLCRYIDGSSLSPSFHPLSVFPSFPTLDAVPCCSVTWCSHGARYSRLRVLVAASDLLIIRNKYTRWVCRINSIYPPFPEHVYGSPLVRRKTGPTVTVFSRGLKNDNGMVRLISTQTHVH